MELLCGLDEETLLFCGLDDEELLCIFDEEELLCGLDEEELCSLTLLSSEEPPMSKPLSGLLSLDEFAELSETDEEPLTLDENEISLSGKVPTRSLVIKKARTTAAIAAAAIIINLYLLFCITITPLSILREFLHYYIISDRYCQ